MDVSLIVKADFASPFKSRCCSWEAWEWSLIMWAFRADLQFPVKVGSKFAALVQARHQVFLN